MNPRKREEKYGWLLRKLVDTVDSRDRLCHVIRSFLPEELAPHLRSIVVRNDTLVLFVRDRTWLPELNYHKTELLSKIQKLSAFAEVRKVKVSVSQRNSKTDPA